MKTTVRLAALLLASLTLVVGLTAPPAVAQDFPAWDPAVAYVEGDIVTFGTTLFVALGDNTGQQPGTAAVWDTYPPSVTTITINVASATGATGPSEADQELLDAIVALQNGAGDEVLGASIDANAAGSTAPLALTGNEVSVPLAIGSSLIGVGGLLVLATRKRSQQG